MMISRFQILLFLQLRPVFVDTLLHRSVRQVACGARHSVFLFNDGKVACVGANNRGQLGTGDSVDSICPLDVHDMSDICRLACGNSHSLAADGMWCSFFNFKEIFPFIK